MISLGWYATLLFILFYIGFQVFFRKDGVPGFFHAVIFSIFMLLGLMFVMEVCWVNPNSLKEMHLGKFEAKVVSYEDVTWISNEISRGNKAVEYEGTDKIGKKRELNADFLSVNLLNEAVKSPKSFRIVTYKVNLKGPTKYVTPIVERHVLEKKTN